MLAVLLATAAWLPALWGLGRLVGIRIGARSLGLAVTGLLGLAALAAAGTVVHFVAPVGPWVAGAAWALGLALFARDARRIVSGTPWPTWIAMAVALALFAAASDLPGRHYDMGLYWLQAVRWTTEAAQPLGIATLHARLGFNSSWFTVCAMLEHPLAAGKSAFVAPALVVTLGAWFAAEGIGEVVRGRRTFPAWLALSTALVVAACVQHLGGHSPDAATAVLGFAALVSWARALEDEAAFREHAGVAIALAAFAATVKVSAIVWLAFSPILLLSRRRAVDWGLARAAAPSVGLLLVWTVNGYLASGCPLFPSTVACLPLPWATPQSVGEEVSGWIRSWARLPGVRPEIVLASWDWLPGWAEGTWRDPIVRLLAWTLAAGAIAVAALRRQASPGFWLLLSAAVAGGAFWFWGAPTPRFGWAYLFALALLPAAETGARLCARGGPWPAAAVGAAALLAAGSVTHASAEWLFRVPSSAFSPVEWPAIPNPPVREVETPAGLRVRMPFQGGDQCWSAPIPCTPYFDPGLSLEGRVFRTATVDPRHP